MSLHTGSKQYVSNQKRIVWKGKKQLQLSCSQGIKQVFWVTFITHPFGRERSMG